MSDWRRIARIAKPRKEEGSLIVQSIDGLPFLLSCGMHVWFVPPTRKGPREADVLCVRQLSDTEGEVRFSGVNDRRVAQRLSGSYCLVRKADLPTDTACDITTADLQGWTVLDRQFGSLGTVTAVIENPWQTLLCVEGDNGEVLIPLVDAFIVDVDEVAHRISVALPQGLIGLNEGQAHCEGQAH